MSRSLEIPENVQRNTPKNDKPRVYNLMGISPTGKVVAISLGTRRPMLSCNLPPCLRGHQVTRLIP